MIRPILFMHIAYFFLDKYKCNKMQFILKENSFEGRYTYTYIDSEKIRGFDLLTLLSERDAFICKRFIFLFLDHFLKNNFRNTKILKYSTNLTTSSISSKKSNNNVQKGHHTLQKV